MQSVENIQLPDDNKDPLNANLAEDQQDDANDINQGGLKADDVNDVDRDVDLEGDEDDELDDTPELDEEDLEDNDLSTDDADKVQWEPPKNS
ncbi:hypothetical protein [Chitinophaga pinensis]|uniref:Uncharacterized protein n=1 Tax=Chitinophaga pinensis TaxID=79329 RepID=A0A5C6LTF2_9BACT|nr:hypothetical protein [Chitinophaga pinensis]TWV98745.1 hypothetical protein FEF09_20170 [Chitinophaga pinensis]